MPIHLHKKFLRMEEFGIASSSFTIEEKVNMLDALHAKIKLKKLSNSSPTQKTLKIRTSILEEHGLSLCPLSKSERKSETDLNMPEEADGFSSDPDMPEAIDDSASESEP